MNHVTKKKMNRSNKNMTLTSRRNSIIYALNGIKLLPGEPNIKLHLIATVGVLIAGFVKHLNGNQWIAIVAAIALVWICETINTAIEKLCDFACNMERSDAIKAVKDISAGAVLMASVTSVVIAVIVFFFQ